MEFTAADLTKEEITLETFRDFIGYMLHDKGLSPVTAEQDQTITNPPAYIDQHVYYLNNQEPLLISQLH